MTYPFPNHNGTTVEVLEWISNFILHSIMEVIIHWLVFLQNSNSLWPCETIKDIEVDNCSKGGILLEESKLNMSWFQTTHWNQCKLVNDNDYGLNDILLLPKQEQSPMVQ